MSVQNLAMQMDVTVTGQSGTVTSSGLTIQPVTITTDPGSIQTGISCGMTGMCGEDPCLCGSPDAYGCCACNGLQTTYPTITLTSSDESIVKPLQLNGKWYLIELGPGQADVTVKSTLIHYRNVTQVEHLTVQPAGVGTIALWLIAAVATLAIIGGLAFGIVRGIRGLINLVRRRRTVASLEHGDE